MAYQLDTFYSTTKTSEGKHMALPMITLDKYRNVVPEEILELWNVGGLGSYMNEFFWVISPDEFQDVVSIVYSPFSRPSVVFARDAFGDLFVWEKDCIKFINVRHGYSEVVGRKPQIFFNSMATDWDYFSERLKEKNFFRAKEKLGNLNTDECYGYFPLLAAGGSERVENIKKVKLKEHLSLIAQMAGRIE